MAKLYPQITPFCLILTDISVVGHKQHRLFCTALVIRTIIRHEDATSYSVRAIKYNFSFPFVNIAGTIIHRVFGKAIRIFQE